MLEIQRALARRYVIVRADAIRDFLLRRGKPPTIEELNNLTPAEKTLYSEFLQGRSKEFHKDLDDSELMAVLATENGLVTPEIMQEGPDPAIAIFRARLLQNEKEYFDKRDKG